jgi:hypothetical protein
LIVIGRPCSGGRTSRTARIGCSRLGPGSIVAFDDDGVQPRIDALNARDMRLDRIAGGNVPLRELRGQRDCTKTTDVVVHHRHWDQTLLRQECGDDGLRKSGAPLFSLWNASRGMPRAGNASGDSFVCFPAKFWQRSFA